MPEDTIFQPQIISFRVGGNVKYLAAFNRYLKRGGYYKKVTFPIKDIYFNNIPELNIVNSNFDHSFSTVFTDSTRYQTGLYIKM